MHVIRGNSVNDLFIDGLWRLKVSGHREDSRNGPVIALDTPATSIYTFPADRVLFNVRRDANPFFHLMESLWMLAGRKDVAFLEHYNKNMRSFSDDGESFNGAYGHRWREWFLRDQIVEAIKMLKHSHQTRRVVIGMWDPAYDLGHPSADIPCNTHIYFRSNFTGLEMTVCCRSNDAVWGAYGANAVHFSILHEFIARAVEQRQGKMYQISNNLHIYEHHWDLLDTPVKDYCPYDLRTDLVQPLFTHSHQWPLFLEDCEVMEVGLYPNYHTKFFSEVVRPAMRSYAAFRAGDINAALSATTQMPMCDWRIAMESWLIRRLPKGEENGSK